jgi:hypothetical protein
MSTYETLDRKDVVGMADSMIGGDSMSAVLEWLAENPDADPIRVELDSLGRLVAINE